MAIQTKVRELAAAPVLANTVPQTRPVGMRLLHVEDNASDALLAQSYIRGVLPDVVFDSAVRISDVTPAVAAGASCAILDLSLPDATGLQALHALRAMSEDLPIIVLTGFDDLDMGLSAIRHGAEDYLVKNYVDGDSLQRAIRYAMERRRLSSALNNKATPRSAERAAVARDIRLVPLRINADATFSRREFFTPSKWFA
jgi:DNA-binding NarL/FixJ family response regulator